MVKAEKKMLYRVSFLHQDNVYEVYVKELCESNIFGFIELSGFVFGENTVIVVDPSEEKLKCEFEGVKRTYIPMHEILRIDEVEQAGTAKIKSSEKSGEKISQFPKAVYRPAPSLSKE